MSEEQSKKNLEKLSSLYETIKSSVEEYNKLSKEAGVMERMAYSSSSLDYDEVIEHIISDPERYNLTEEELPSDDGGCCYDEFKALIEKLIADGTFDPDEYMGDKYESFGVGFSAPGADGWFPSLC